jgi:hypothetical protein
VAVAPFDLTKGDNIFFAPFEIKMKGVVLMIYSSHLYVTYDNDGRYFSGRNYYSNYCVFKKSQVKEKDNRPSSKSSVIF